MIKINLLCGFMLLVLVSFSGCSGTGEKYLTPDEIAMQQSNDIMAALTNNDKDAFKEFLCSDLRDEHSDLDSKIDELFDFVDGDIISFDVDYPAARGGTTTPLEGWVKQFITTEIKNIYTNSGKSYNIHYTFTTIYNEHPEQLGITYICIFTSDAPYDPVTGFPPDKCRIITIYD